MIATTAAVLTLLALGGCSQAGTTAATQTAEQTAEHTDASSQSQPPGAGEPAAPSAAVAQFPALEPSEKRALIAPSFPVEVPVPAGTVVRGQAQGESAWDYEITCTLSAAELVQWYRMAYEGRAWQLIDQQSGRTEKGHDFVELELGKGFSQSRLTITDEGGHSRVVAVVGLGEAVLESQ